MFQFGIVHGRFQQDLHRKWSRLLKFLPTAPRTFPLGVFHDRHAKWMMSTKTSCLATEHFQFRHTQMCEKLKSIHSIIKKQKRPCWWLSLFLYPLLPSLSRSQECCLETPTHLLPITHTNIELMHNLTSRPHPKRCRRLIYSNGTSIIHGELRERRQNSPLNECRRRRLALLTPLIKSD